MSTKVEAPKRYRVTAPYITVKSPASGFSLGNTRTVQIFGLYQGSILPPDVATETIERLLRGGMIEEIADV